MTKKRIICLVIYAIVVIIGLIFIIFFAPEKWFQRDLSDFNLPMFNSSSQEKEVIDYETQKEYLMSNNYEYTYNILYNTAESAYNFECKGKINKETEEGSCTLPDRVEYTEKNKQEVFNKINTNLLDPSYIFNLIKDIKPEEIKNEPYTEYTYNLTYSDLKTEIIIRSDDVSISEIIITNVNMVYHLKFTNIRA